MLFRKKKVHKTPNCLNCGYTFVSEEHNSFCPSCGQKNQRLLTLKETLEEFVGSIFSYDSRVYQSLLPFIFKPGKLTKEFIRGRRTHYIHPIRLYLVVSLFYFTLASPRVVDFKGASKKISEQSYVHKTEKLVLAYEDSLLANYKNPVLAEKFYQKAQAFQDSIKKSGVNVLKRAKSPTKSLAFSDEEDKIDVGDVITYNLLMNMQQKKGNSYESSDIVVISADNERPTKEKTKQKNKTKKKKEIQQKEVEQITEAQIMDSLNIEKNFVNTLFVKQTLRFSDSTVGQIIQYFVNRASLLMFLMIPAFAGILKLFYIRGKSQFMEHLIFSFHIHSFIFFVWGLVMLLSPFSYLWLRVTLAVVALVVYIYVAFLRVYEQGVIKTFIKMFLTINVYLFLISILLTLGLIASLLIF